MADEKQTLPAGAHLYLPQLPHGTTAAALSEFFNQNYLPIGAEAISVRDFTNDRDSWSGALISVTPEVVLELLKWALEDKTYEGRPLHVSFPKSSMRYKAQATRYSHR